MLHPTRLLLPLVLTLLALTSRVIAQSSSDTGGATEHDATSAEPPADDARFHFLDAMRNPFSTEDDPDGPIATDRPSFTPSNAIVPAGRLQVESGYTYTHDRTRLVRQTQHGFPEFDIRAGLNAKTELRLLWGGQNYLSQFPRGGGPAQRFSGLSDVEFGFGRLLTNQKRWLPQTKLNLTLLAPTSGSSMFSQAGGTVQPSVGLIYGWALGKKLSLGGISGFNAFRSLDSDPRVPADSYQQFSQSAIASYSPSQRVTVFGEWYVLYRTNAADNLPSHFAQSGLLYHPTPNTQLDIRAGLGLGDHPSDFFTGAGFSIRF